ncbi:MAG: hypothetical protein IJD86_00625 [Clostridia bacterium]|nr:hypothetical protein [Clostridia bacterium]
MKYVIRFSLAFSIMSVLAILLGRFLQTKKADIDISVVTSQEFDSLMNMYYAGLKIVNAAMAVLLISAVTGAAAGIICVIKRRSKA